MKLTKYISPVLFVVTLLSLSCCEKNVLENGQDINVGTIKYNVAFEQSAGTKAADESAGTVLALSDKSGSLTVPMECEVREGIALASGPAITKGTLVNTTGNDDKTLATFSNIVGSFIAKAFDTNGSEKVFQTVTWNESSSAWVGSPVAYWPQATILNFLAYANLPSGQSATIASTGVSTSHTVPALAEAQTDILFGHYSGNGGNTGTAEISFEHPLTAVMFKLGESALGSDITSIELTNVAKSGTASMDIDGNVSWTDVLYNGTVSQADEDALGPNVVSLCGEDVEIIGEPFIIIPQSLATNNVTVNVSLADGSELSAQINSGQWEAGQTNLYTIGIKSDKEYELMIEASPESGQSFVAYDGGIVNMKVSSSYTTDEVEYIPVPWKAQYSYNGADWFDSKNAESGSDTWISSFDGSTGSGGRAFSAAGSFQISTMPSEKHDVQWNDERAGTSSSAPWDLSRNEVYSSSSSPLNTANCYVVDAPGWYCFPLAYGNAIKNGVTNTSAHISDAPFNSVCGGHPYLSTNWPDNNGKTITSADVLWQETGAGISDVTLLDGKYIKFHADPGTIEGNALIGASSAEGIEWSWHIWVAEIDLENEHATVRSKATNKEYDFLGRDVGQVITSQVDYYGAGPGNNEDREVFLRVASTDGSNKYSEPITVQQRHFRDDVNATYTSNSYQWGRKDPFYRSMNAEYSSPVQLNLAHKYPTTWFFGPDLNANKWYIENYDNLWGASGYDLDENNYKTIFDPSPVGYKVPNTDSFRGFTSTAEVVYSDSDLEGDIVGSYVAENFAVRFKDSTGNPNQYLLFRALGGRAPTITGAKPTTGFGSEAYFYSATPINNVMHAYMFMMWPFVPLYDPLYEACRSAGYPVRPIME